MRGGTISSCDDTCSRCVNLPEKKEERSINITFEKKLELLCNGRRKKGMERNEKKNIEMEGDRRGEFRKNIEYGSD